MNQSRQGGGTLFNDQNWYSFQLPLTVAAQADRSDTKLNTVMEKLDAVAADLSAHRADTEVHKKVYKVKED